MHFLYSFVLILYTKNAIMEYNEDQVLYGVLLAAGVIYPAGYDLTQLYKTGLVEYLSEGWNYADLLYIMGSIVNIGLQLSLGPLNIWSRIVMCIIVALLVTKTFFFLRIFPMLTPIVVMLINVVYDLRIFIVFYIILLSGSA